MTACVCLAETNLKSRGIAGFIFRPIKDEDVRLLKLPDSNGVIVRQIMPDTAASRAGLAANDVIRKYDDKVILDDSQFSGISRLYYAGDRINVSILRDGKLMSLNLIMGEPPREKSGSVEIEYTSFSNQNLLFRAVVTSPPGGKNKKLPALLLVSALGSPRLINSSNYDLFRSIAYAAAKAGFRVMRFELRGYGDSSGEDYRTTDFETEIGDNIAALNYLMKRSDVDEDKVFVMGHSTGGIIAAIIAGKCGVAGLIASCTIGLTYYERMAMTVRLQDQFAGKSAAEIERNLKDYIDFTTSIARGETLEAILKRNPVLLKFANKSRRIMDDRSVEYWRQQLNINLSEVYGGIKLPVLIVYGASDFITTLKCHKHIRDVLLAAGNSDVTLFAGQNFDHRYALAKDQKESYDNYKTMNFKPDPEPIDKIIKWLVEHK
jgi:alpha-beta hydrolase superfamily lysophospholipase